MPINIELIASSKSDGISQVTKALANSLQAGEVSQAQHDACLLAVTTAINQTSDLPMGNVLTVAVGIIHWQDDPFNGTGSNISTTVSIAPVSA